MSFIIREVANEDELQQVFALRHTVFVEEQGIPAYLDKDGRDENSRHVIGLTQEGEIVAGGRLSPHPTENLGIISRISVSKDQRKKGLGKQVIQELEVLARAESYKALRLKPHVHLEAFYQNMGYHTLSKEVRPVGQHSLLLMEKTL